jgi:RNA polymerase sigma-70 factor (ECF subfamily)
MELVNRFQQTNDNQIIITLIDRYADALTALSFRFVRNEDSADDLGQELFLTLAEKLPNAEVRNFRSWLLQTARNRLIDRDRRLKRMDTYQSQLKEESFSPDQVIDQRLDESDMLKAAFAMLSEREQLCIRLHYWEYQSYKEIGEVMGLKFNQVRGALDRAILKLRKQLGGHFDNYFLD